ncbi:hypothetical protein PUR23_13330 [Methylorubrum populi]|uniref:hypothetical protein n=1 Tax=Methylorubrum populi TaxID=223967 RepID=UPI0031F8D1B1
MSEQLQQAASQDIESYDVEIPLRGYRFNLQDIKSVYRALQKINDDQGRKIVGAFVKPENETEEMFESRKEHILDRAFRLTVSIFGYDGASAYRDREGIFDSTALPKPIRTIFFTNASAYRAMANGEEPTNNFKLWIHFDGPPLFDPNPLQSEPTLNPSKIHIKADNIVFFQAVQGVINAALKKDRLWYSPFHGRFVYDIGLWLLWLPYSLYTVTSLVDRMFPADGPRASYRIGAYIYGLGLALLIYRFLMGYAKWAFPVNILRENADAAAKHRIIFGALALGIFGSAVWDAIKLSW